MEKWPSGLEDVLTRVPLLIRTPGGAAGHVVKEPVQLFDIVPTIMEIAGLPADHVHFGKSLVPQLKGAPGNADWAAYSEGGYASFEPRDFEGGISGIGSPHAIYYPKLKQQQEKPLSVMRATSVRTLTHKLVLRSDPTAPDRCSELYDLSADPQELNNLYNNSTYASVQAELEHKIFQWMLWTSDVTPWKLDPRGGHWTPSSTKKSAASGNADDFMERDMENVMLSPPSKDYFYHVADIV